MMLLNFAPKYSNQKVVSENSQILTKIRKKKKYKVLKDKVKPIMSEQFKEYPTLRSKTSFLNSLLNLHATGGKGRQTGGHAPNLVHE